MKRTFAGLAAALLAVIAAPAQATTVLDLTLEQLAQRAPVVVRGFVDSQKSGWDAEHTRIVTRTNVRVTRKLKGTAGAVVTVRQNAGTLDGITMGAPGEAKFVPGEEVLLFLEPHPTDAGAHVLMAMAAAKFTIRRTDTGSVAERNLDGLAFARAGADGVLRPSAPSSPAVLPLDTILKTIDSTTTGR